MSEETTTAMQAAVTQARKKRRCAVYKEEAIAENAVLKMRVHELETELKYFRELPTMRRIVFAIRGR